MRTDVTAHIRWRFQRAYEAKRDPGFVRYSPSEKRFQNVHAKIARKVGVSRQATIIHAKYLENKDRRSILAGKQDLIGRIGDPIAFAKQIGGDYEHYRAILAPKRGDLMDVCTLVVNTVKEVELHVGRIEYAAAIHKPDKPNSAGIHNVHAHLIIKGGYGKGGTYFKKWFREAAAREATRQIELGVGERSNQLEIARQTEMHRGGNKRDH